MQSTAESASSLHQPSLNQPLCSLSKKCHFVQLQIHQVPSNQAGNKLAVIYNKKFIALIPENNTKQCQCQH